MAKLAFHCTRGNINHFYAPGVDITDIFAWVVVIDNGEGANATAKDYTTFILLTDGSDIGTGTIPEIDNMEPQVFLDWMRDYLLPIYGVPYDAYLSPIDNGSVQVR